MATRSRSSVSESSNFELFDFELDAADVSEIAALDRGEDGRTGPNPDTFAYVPD